MYMYVYVMYNYIIVYIYMCIYQPLTPFILRNINDINDIKELLGL